MNLSKNKKSRRKLINSLMNPTPIDQDTLNKAMTESLDQKRKTEFEIENYEASHQPTWLLNEEL